MGGGESDGGGPIRGRRRRRVSGAAWLRRGGATERTLLASSAGLGCGPSRRTDLGPGLPQIGSDRASLSPLGQVCFRRPFTGVGCNLSGGSFGRVFFNCCGSPSAERITAIHRLPSNCARMTLDLTASGVRRNAPVTPQIALQNASERSTITGS